jgi:cytochrome c oxidase subunit 2
MRDVERWLRRLLQLPEAASTYAFRVDRLHFFVIIVTMAAAALIGLAALTWIVRYRRRPGRETGGRYVPPRWMEPLIIFGPLSLFLLWFAIGFYDFVYLQSPPKDAMDVYITAKKWMWKFSYPGGPSSVEVLTIPAGRPVRALLTSRDVIHSFFVPAFRVKQDAIPARYTQTWFEATKPGRYEVFCAEYCGLSHSMMRAEVVVLEPDEFDAWLADQRRGLAARQDAGAPLGPIALVEQGRAASVRRGCFACHSIDGAPHIGPTWLDLYHRTEDLEGGGTVFADEAYLTESMMDPGAKIVLGYQNLMPTFQGILSAPEAAAIVEYIKTLQSGALRPLPARGPVYEPRRR